MAAQVGFSLAWSETPNRFSDEVAQMEQHTDKEHQNRGVMSLNTCQLLFHIKYRFFYIAVIVFMNNNVVAKTGT